MLPQLSVTVLAVAAAFLTSFPETTAIRATDLLRAPPPDGRRVTGIAKGERLRLYECEGTPAWCRVEQLAGSPLNGWVAAMRWMAHCPPSERSGWLSCAPPPPHTAKSSFPR